ncbi:hypothetical protein ACFX1X_013302 [Malus domestica]
MTVLVQRLTSSQSVAEGRVVSNHQVHPLQEILDASSVFRGKNSKEKTTFFSSTNDSWIFSITFILVSLAARESVSP